ncbi:MAG: ABC transporter permease [Victivallales bacterium]|nr:ABC transporter permease [Victivallales bacterium]
MNYSEIKPPSIANRIYSVWFRHYRVYIKNIFSNGFPPFVEPLIFLLGMGLGLGRYLSKVDNMPYIQYLATGLPLASAMFTSAFECTIGTFIRIEFQKAYDGMLTGPVTINNLFTGEIIWCGTKGAFYSSAVLTVFILCNTLELTPGLILIPAVGFIVGVMVSPLSLLFTSFVKTINTLNFFLTGLITPMFMFSGIIFPVSNLPAWIQWIIEVFPLVHAVNLVHALSAGSFKTRLIFDIIYCIAFTAVVSYIAIKRMEKRIMY